MPTVLSSSKIMPCLMKPMFCSTCVPVCCRGWYVRRDTFDLHVQERLVGRASAMVRPAHQQLPVPWASKGGSRRFSRSVFHVGPVSDTNDTNKIQMGRLYHFLIQATLYIVQFFDGLSHWLSPWGIQKLYFKPHLPVLNIFLSARVLAPTGF